MSFVPSFENYGTHDESEYPQLWHGRVLSLCPSVNPAGGTRLIDHSHYRNWGTLTNGPTWASIQGKNCVDLDGTDDSVLIGDVEQVDFAGTSFSISVWLCVDSLPVSIGGAILSKWNTSSRQYILNVRASSGANPSTVEFETGSGSSDGGCRSTQTIAVNSLVHLVAVHNHLTTTNTLYWNGVQEASAATVAPVATTRLLYLGRRDDAANPNYLNCKLNDIAFYNRALGSEEIRELYQIGQGGAYTPRSRMFYPLPQQQTFLAAWARRSPQLIGGGTL